MAAGSDGDGDGDLGGFLARHPPFDSLKAGELADVAAASTIGRYRAGALILDAFSDSNDTVFVIVEGAAAMWNSPDHLDDQPDETLRPGDAFGFSALLTKRRVGPRVVATAESTVACIPGEAAGPALSSRPGARFLAERLSHANAQRGSLPSYGVVDELLVTAPFTVAGRTHVAELARAMTERRVRYAAVPLDDGGYGLVTDAVLRERVLAAGLDPGTSVAEIVLVPAPTVRLGDSSAEAMIELLDGPADLVLVLDRQGRLSGVIDALDFVVSPATAGVSLREQIRFAATVDELVERAERIPAMLGELLRRGLASSKVIAVHSATVDAVVRRALTLVFAGHPDLSVDAFTWLALGSNGRREAVLSSDLDAAVAFAGDLGEAEQNVYRTVFGDVEQVLVRAGLPIDRHGTAPNQTQFSRTNAQWREAATAWLAAPELDSGAIMTSLLVDGRPIHGDPGLPEVARVFGEFRQHPATVRLLLQESLSYRAKLRSMKDVLARRAGTFDIKKHGLLPVINIARWAALSVGSTELSTTARLRAAAGSQMLPDEHAGTLVEVFEVLQRLRLRYQLAQTRRGDGAGDVLTMSRLSPIDRSVIAQAVREISAIQKRMDNVAAYADVATWSVSPD